MAVPRQPPRPAAERRPARGAPQQTRHRRARRPTCRAHPPRRPTPRRRPRLGPRRRRRLVTLRRTPRPPTRSPMSRDHARPPTPAQATPHDWKIADDQSRLRRAPQGGPGAPRPVLDGVHARHLTHLLPACRLRLRSASHVDCSGTRPLTARDRPAHRARSERGVGSLLVFTLCPNGPWNAASGFRRNPL
jgi:hypothetical protein